MRPTRFHPLSSVAKGSHPHQSPLLTSVSGWSPYTLHHRHHNDLSPGQPPSLRPSRSQTPRAPGRDGVPRPPVAAGPDEPVESKVDELREEPPGEPGLRRVRPPLRDQIVRDVSRPSHSPRRPRLDPSYVGVEGREGDDSGSRPGWRSYFRGCFNSHWSGSSSSNFGHSHYKESRSPGTSSGPWSCSGWSCLESSRSRWSFP